MKYSDSLNDANFGVIILCPDCNLGNLKYTVNSLKVDFPQVSYVVMVGNSAHVDNVKDMEKLSRVYKGGKTITSLIDVGMKHMHKKWVAIITAGSRFKSNVFKKYCYFAKNDKDILFPVVDRKYLFNEASINGILMSKKAIKEIGDFGDERENIEEAKLIWAGKAIDKGYIFKALVGARLI